MKIIIGSDNYYPNVNGASYFSQRLAEYMQKRGHEVLVIAPGMSMWTKAIRVNEINVFGLSSFPIFIYKGFRWPLALFAKKDIEKAVLDFAPDVIHIQDHFFIGGILAKFAKKNGVPSVGTNHFMPENLTHYLHLPEKLEKVVSQTGWRYFRMIYGMLDMVTSPTETAVKLLNVVGLKKKAVAVSCGIDLNRFNPNNDGTAIRAKYSLPTIPTLLYVGRLDKEKNIDVLLQAFSLITQKVNAHFVVAGKGAEKERLEALSSSLGIADKVTFAGFVEDRDLPNMYRIASCFVIGGIAELQSIVTMEAMASGLPVIAVNAMALPELVKHEKNGYLFEISEKEKLAEYMFKILSNDSLQKEMAQNSLEIIQKHAIENSLSTYEKIYQDVLATHR
jgi:glycosyltransferase involved in cell wall biosynthesis